MAQPCHKLASMYDNSTELLLAYPICKDSSAWAAVAASMEGDEANVAAIQGMTFGAAVWLAVAIHAIGVEFYVGYD